VDAQLLHRAEWRKSTYSGQNGSCIEVATWYKSSHSGQNGACIEVARGVSDVVGVRDSKDPDGPKLAFTPQGWQAFIQRVRSTTPTLG
jgi:hypothetical protein